MKKIILLISIFTVFTAYSQEIILPLNYEGSKDVPERGYLKDLFDVFNPYIGTWQGTWNGKTFILKIEKVTKELHSFESGYFYYRDRLIGKYIVKDNATGSIISTTMNNVNLQEAEIKSLAYPKENKFEFLYETGDECYVTGKIRLKGNPATNQLQYFYFPDEFWRFEECHVASAAEVLIPIPTEPMILTRVN